ncbi:FAD-dependent oxidoreductase [Hathewaya histolytica]|uniref:Putative flavoprotein n=1 Tax=Hathewaya histolytica TaxID=1498 RepID=A0A4U9QWH2_HATHI|nr:FAD-dependent oxidoreductase [Hathewaya histolytica]VTQ83164.1 putative flavoprotein [Hathewaya histolytica]
MKAYEIKKDVYWCGALDPNLRIFDIIMYTPFGTTYNSYVIKGKNKTAIVETVKEKFFDEYLERLKSINVNLEDVDYIILNHTEPDHAGSLDKLLKLSPKAKVVASQTALRFLKDITNMEFDYIEAKEGETLDLGEKTLEFISAPFLHWPDSMYTYLKEDNVLFTCDSFGCHYCNEDIFDDYNANERDYREALKYYFDNIMGPFKPYMLKAIDKIKELKIYAICNGHGPVLRKNLWDIVNQYKIWSLEEGSAEFENTVSICYVSAYGYTEMMTNAISKGIESVGDIKVNSYDLSKDDFSDVLSKINISNGILLGTPTINGDALKPLWDILINLNPIVHGGKIAGSYGSFGWSGEGPSNLTERLKQLRMDVVDPLKINFKPSEEDLKVAFNYGEAFGNKLKAKFAKDSNTSIRRKKLWKCLICGEIFEGDTPPEICSACGVGEEYFVEITEEVINYSQDNNDKICILGNGASGYYAAESIRKRNKTCNITIFSEEEEVAYYRPALSELLGDDKVNNNFYLSSKEWYNENNIDLRLGVKVEKVNTIYKKLILKDGVEVSYDRLILANGSRNFMPLIKGIDKNGVFTLRDLKDLENIKSYIGKCNKAVVVGGGLLGLEAAWAMKKSGKDVTIIEFADHILNKQLDKEGAQILNKKLEEAGVKALTGSQVVEILEEDKISYVKLNTGEEIEADMVLFSIGIRSNIELFKGTDISLNRGVIVNNKMETSAREVYACGDVAELNERVYGNWPASIEMAKIAGANVCGDERQFIDYVDVISFNAMNTTLISCGTIPEESSSVITINNKEKGIYKKFFFKDDVLVSGILIGDTSDSIKLINGVKKEEDFNSFAKKLSFNI